MNAKRILAILGIAVLIGIYLLSLIFALIDHPMKSSMMYASLYATVVIPVLVYAFLLIAKLLHKDENEDEERRP
ncbi:MAG: hypothetical protein J6I64_05860 [Lachnospiraceae bacterium]|nr:hypothetical protein [Lachnospiraceae bacterium]